MKKLIVFDLDGTLTESKVAIEPEMAEVLGELLKQKQVAVMGGGTWRQFNKQLLDHLNYSEEQYKNLFLFPTNGSQFYKYNKGVWENVYNEELTFEEREEITAALEEALDQTGLRPKGGAKGQLIEDRFSQITYSGLGQEASIDEKERWDPDKAKREKLKQILDQRLPNYEVRIAGTTSIDITHQRIDKAFGIRQMEKYLDTPQKDMLFIGDAIYAGGNDEAVTKTEIEIKRVTGPEETEKEIGQILKRD